MVGRILPSTARTIFIARRQIWCIKNDTLFLDVCTVFVTFTVYFICVFILLPSGVIND